MSSAATAPATPGVHANVAPVSALLGRWVGTGKGVYPTINPFEYEEEVTFTTSARPFVAYTQRTWMANSNRSKPMHEESGFLRFVGGAAPGAAVEAVISQASGVQEVEQGNWSQGVDGSFTIALQCSSLSRTPSAKQPHVTAVARRFHVDASKGELSIEVDMATTNTPQLQNHLRATLKKQE